MGGLNIRDVLGLNLFRIPAVVFRPSFPGVFGRMFFLVAALWTALMAQWRTCAPGLELGSFKLDSSLAGTHAVLVVLRIEPAKWEFVIPAVSRTGEEHNRTIVQWCEKYGLVAAVNAGMYHKDNLTHVGYLSCGGHVNSSVVNHYQSAAAFGPKRAGAVPFRLYDLDVDGIDAIRKNYDCVVQNLRLIKRKGENRWAPQQKKWSETALAEDEKGRALFLFCAAALTMHAFNRSILALPLGIVAAQHLEGGAPAQFYLNTADTTVHLAGVSETGILEQGQTIHGWPLPFVLGVKKRGAR